MGIELVEQLRRFDSHERAILLQQATGDFRLTDGFREDIERVIGTLPPPNAFVAMDYTIDWLYAALWSARELVDSPVVRPTGAEITASIEDIDLVIAWEGHPRPHLVLVEAKGFTPWTNKQMLSKMKRLKAVLEPFKNDVDVDFVLAGPQPSRRLDATGWPDWALTAGQPNFLTLRDPGDRFAIQRCNAGGVPTNTDWTHWRVNRRRWTTSQPAPARGDAVEIREGTHPTLGKVTVTKRVASPPERSHRAHMEERWAADQTVWPDATAPDRPDDWKNFFEQYFGDRGVWIMRAHETGAGEIDETGPIELKCSFNFFHAEDGLCVEIVGHAGSHAPCFTDLREAMIVAPGIVAIHAGSGMWLLDGHLTQDDLDWIHETGRHALDFD